MREPVASPVLVDGDFVLWEANAIVRYLVARCDGGRFYPDDARVRADIDRWMDYQLSTIRGFLHTLLRDDLDARAVSRNAERLAATMEPVEATLTKQPYLCGDAFTIGDIPVGITTYRWRVLDVVRPASPAIDAWLQRLGARPAFAATIRPPRGTYVTVQESPSHLGNNSNV